tara:strand:- start:514 stop:735 length:222 start_codon:yes stop_codon:yes gene_type:complete
MSDIVEEIMNYDLKDPMLQLKDDLEMSIFKRGMLEGAKLAIEFERKESFKSFIYLHNFVKKYDYACSEEVADE